MTKPPQHLTAAAVWLLAAFHIHEAQAFYIPSVSVAPTTPTTRLSVWFSASPPTPQGAPSSSLVETLESSFHKILSGTPRQRSNQHLSQQQELVQHETFSDTNVRVELQTVESEAHDLAWLSSLKVVHNIPSVTNIPHPVVSYVSLMCWNGPRLDVPHLYVSCGRDCHSKPHDPYHLTINFCPRRFGAWDTVMNDGASFPEPNTRSAFYERQVREEQRAEFFTNDLIHWSERIVKEQEHLQCNKLAKVPTTSVLLPRQIPPDCAGPVRLEMTVDSQVHAAQYLSQAVDALVQWRRRHTRTDSSVKAMQTYAWDCQTRPALTEFAGQQLQMHVPPTILDQVTQSHTGPPDLADRSAAMTAAAQENFEIDHMVEATQSD